jgi:hypothetical protein
MPRGKTKTVVPVNRSVKPKGHRGTGQRNPRHVYERWLLRNGSFAIIRFRIGFIAVGEIEGTDQIYMWQSGENSAGPGYALASLHSPVTPQAIPEGSQGGTK